MIFTQRLFTVLLGMLFVVVLSDNALALYDPGVGRFCSRDPIGYEGDQNLYRYTFSSPMVLVDPSGLQTAPPIQDSPPKATRLENNCGCCCCPTNIDVKFAPFSVENARKYEQKVDITFSVKMKYTPAPKDAKNTTCKLSFLEYIDPASSDNLVPFENPESFFDYTRWPKGQWIDHIETRRKFFENWEKFESPESRNCNGESTWEGTDKSQVSVSPGEKLSFWQLVSVSGGDDCKCKPNIRYMVTNIIYDPSRANKNPTGEKFPPWTRRPTLPNFFPLPR